MFGSLSTKIAHSTALGNQDLRLLQEAINKEKEFITSAQRLSKDLGAAGDAFKQWGAGEGEDLGDLGYSAMVLCNHATAAISMYADHTLAIRSQLKDTRTKEEQLDELRRRRKAVGSKLEGQEKRLSKMSSEHKSLSLANEQYHALQNEIRQLDTSILSDMAKLSDHKRTVTRSILLLRFGGLAELGEKLCIIGEMGKLLAEEVPQEITPPGQGRPPYMARNTTASLVSEATRLVSEVAFSANADPDFATKQNLAKKRVSTQDTGPNAIGLDVGSRFGTMPPQAASSQSNLPLATPVASGTMPALRDSEKGAANYGGQMDEFGRPIDGLPPQANTMPPLRQGGSQFRRTPGYPIEQVPLESIQGSMRTSFERNERPSSAGSATSSGTHSRFAPQGGALGGAPPGRMGHAPNGSGSGFAPPHAPPSMGGHLRPPQQGPPAQNSGGAGLERGLTLSLPIRSPAPEDDDNDEPRVADPRPRPSQQSNVGPPGAQPPSSFKQPIAARTAQRQGTTDSDIVLAEGDSNLQRIPTLPPTLGMPKIGAEEGLGDFPAWSLGFGEFGADGSSAKEKGDEENDNDKKGDKAESPPPPRAPASKSSAGDGEPEQTPISALPKHLLQGRESAPGSPLVQTPSTYSATGSAPGSQNQTPTAGIAPTPSFLRGDPPTILHTNVVDNPATRVSGNSGQFSQFPVKRKPVNMSLSEDSNAPTPTPGSGSTLPPPEPKFAAHPGLPRRPSPYPGESLLSGVSPIPTPASERPGSSGTQDSMPDFIPPRVDGEPTDPAPKSILVGSDHHGTSSQPASRSGTGGSGAEAPRLRFAPRPPSPITPSPVSPTYQIASAWASGENVDNEKGVGPIGGGSSTLSPALGVSQPAGDSPSSEAQYATRRSDANRLSVISPLEIHKTKDGNSLPGTPAKGVYTGEPDMTEDELSAMIDSLASQIGDGASPNTSSNPNSLLVSRQNSSIETSASSNTSSRRMVLNTDDVSLDDIYGSPAEQEQYSATASNPPSSLQPAPSAIPMATPATSQPARSPSLSTNISSQIKAPSPRSSSLKYSNSPSVSPLPSPGVGAPITGSNQYPQGPSAYSSYAPRGPPGPHDREDSTDSYSEENRPNTINASAFKKGGGLPSHPAQGRFRDDPGVGRGASSGRSTPDSARGTPSSQHAALPPQGQQPYNRGPPDQSNMTPRQYDRPIPPGQSAYQGGQAGVYNAGIPQGAAPPSRYGAPGDPIYQQEEQRRQSPPQGYPGPGPANNMYPQQQGYGGVGSGPATPISPVGSSGPHIPSSLLPGRPGSAAPLASIGVSGPGPRNYVPSPGPGYSPQASQPQMQSYPSSHITAPWQQGPRPAYQGQYSATPIPNNMLPPGAGPGMMQRGPTPMTGEFDGSNALQNAYGGFGDSPYAGARNPGQGGPGGYGRGGPPMQGPGYGRGGW